MNALRKIVRQTLNEAVNKSVTLYHGTNYPEQVKGNSDFFFSVDKHFAEDYGDKLLECQVNLGKVFDSTNPKHIKALYAAGFKLTDEYILSAYDKDDEIGTFYDFDNDYYPSAELFVKGPFFDQNTWEPIEHTPGVIGWIFSNGFDSIKIIEDGIINYYTSGDNVISKKEVNKTKPPLDFFNEAHYTTWKSIEEGSPIDSFKGQQNEIIQKLASQLNIKKIFPAGQGTQGFAYYIPNNRILKITKDKSEAAEAYKIKGKKLKHLANIYEVYTLKGKYEGVYVIISEFLNNSEEIDNADQLLADFLDSEFGYSISLFFEDYSNGSMSKDEIKDYIKKINEFYRTDSYNARQAIWYMKGKFGIIDDIKKNNIHSTDWGLTNLGLKKDGNIAMYDLIYSDSDVPSEVPNIHLNEKQLEEYWGANEYPAFDDGQFNPTFHNRPSLAPMNLNLPPLSEIELSSDELNKKELPLKFHYMWGDFVKSKGAAVREIMPNIGDEAIGNTNTDVLVKDLAENDPATYDEFAEWIYNSLHSQSTIG